MSRFMTGLLMGVGIGLLLAPEKGEDTRESIAETAGNLKDKFNRLVGRAGARNWLRFGHKRSGRASVACGRSPQFYKGRATEAAT